MTWRQGHILNDAVWRRRSRFLLAVPLGGALASCNALPEDLSVPPTQMTGSVGYSVQTRRVPTQSRELTQQVTGTVNANSYIWQPWFATTQGTLRLTREQTSGGATEDGSTFASGDLTVSLLPASKFPTTLSYSRADSRVDGTAFSTDYTTDRVSLTNFLFLPENWTASSGFSYEQTKFSDHGTDRVMHADLTVNKTFETQSVQLALRHDDSVFQTVSHGEESDRTSLAAFRHLYSPFKDANVQSSTTILNQTGVLQDIERKIFSIQGVSTGQWRPRDLPFAVNGALRTLSQSLGLKTRRGAFSEFDSDTTLVSAVAGLNYPLAPGLTANMGVTANYQSVDSESRSAAGATSSTSLATESVGVLGGINYYSEPFLVAGFDYSWNASANALLQIGTEDLSNQSGSTTLGHQASRIFDMPLIGPTYVSLSETARFGYSTFGEGLFGLTHTLSLTHDFGGTRARTYAQASATDSRDMGNFSSSYQLAALQLNRAAVLDLESSWQMGLSLQAYRIVIEDIDSGWRTTVNGTASYNKRNLFGVNDLNFRSMLILNAVGLGSVIETQRERRLRDELRSQWINRLDYRIGQLLVSLEGRIFREKDDFGDLVRFQIRRLF